MVDDKFPSAPYANISDVYSETFHSIASISTTVSFCISLTILPWYIYVVARKSPKSMTTFQRLLLGYICATLLFLFAMISLKPLVLLPFLAIYPVGFLAPMPAKIGLFLIFLAAAALSAMADLLLTMLAQRYFALIKFKIRKIHWISQIFYAALFGSYLLFISSFCVLFFVDTLSDSDAQALILSHISGSSPMILYQPGMVVANYENLHFAKVALFVAGIHVFTRAMGFCFFLYRNITLPKQLELEFSTNARIQHKMLITSISAQLFGIFLFVILPFFVILIFVLIPTLPGAYKAWICLMCFLNNFIIYDSIVTIICIKHYRNFFMNLFCRQKDRQRVSSIVGVTSSVKRATTY